VYGNIEKLKSIGFKNEIHWSILRVNALFKDKSAVSLPRNAFTVPKWAFILPR
jgi:hypothetical protein